MSRNRAHTRNRPQLVKSANSSDTAVLDWKPGKQSIDAPVLIPLDEQIRPILREARGKTGKSRAFSYAWDETEALGITADMRRSGPGMLSDADRKDTLYKAYLNSVWISACVDVIAKRITSGGMVIEATESGPGSQSEYDDLHQFLHYINDDDDFLQLIREIATDLLIYGECYMEVVQKGGKPFSLHKIDCCTMNYQLDQHGTVVKYIQNMQHSTTSIEFAPDEIIRWWFPDPRASKKALSPIERILGSIDADVHMADWVRSFFRKGARPNFWIKFPGSLEEANRFVAWLRENYTGAANAHVPLVLFDEAELYEIGKGSIDIDFLKGREQMCKEILAGYQVPPALVGLIESGNIGGGTGESQEKSFLHNACDPLKHLIFEKFNYRIVHKGFGIEGWRAGTRYADYRSDESVAKIQDTQIRNGSLNINEVRAELGKPEVEGGDANVIITTREVTAVGRLAELEDEQRQTVAVTIQHLQAQADLTNAQVEKTKNPPPPPAPMVQPGQQPPQAPVQQQKPPSGNEQAQAAERAILHTQLSSLIERLEHQTRTEDVRHEAAQLLNNLLSTARPLAEDEPKSRIAERMDALEEQLRVIRAKDTTPRKPRTRKKAEPKAEEEQADAAWDAVLSSPEGQQTLKKLVDEAREEIARGEYEEGGFGMEEAEQHTGVMVAFMLDPEAAQQLAIPGGEPANIMHVTLAFLGDKNEITLDADELKRELGGFASEAMPLKGTTGGLGRFTPSDSSDGKAPVIALVNVPGLQEWRASLVKRLKSIGVDYAKNFDYQPHITLAYVDADAPTPVDSVPTVPLVFDRLTLCIGDEHTSFPIGDEQYPDYWEDKEHVERPSKESEALSDAAGDSDSERPAVRDEASGPAEADLASNPGITEQQTSGARERLSKWREPGPEQIELEAELKRLLKRLQFRKDSQPSQEDKEAIVQQVATLLDRARTIGRAHATDSAQEDGAWGGKFVNILQSAWDIVTNFVDRIAGWISGQDPEALTEEDIAAEVDTEVVLVADTEIAAAIESAVMDELQAQGYESVVWTAQPGACKLCQGNADQGPVPINTAFESGDERPPAHPTCRCSLSTPKEEG